jgi:D-glycero-D-manno-heptose 1,7-bisphosphate phosphatase
MLYTICERLDIELSSVVLVGDSLRDMQAAMAAAATPILVRTGKGQKTLDNNKGLEHIPAFDNLASYVDELLATEDE